MDEITDPTTLCRHVRQARCAGSSVGLVPTMGYLHVGHLSLFAAARAENQLVVASLYVNPTQFGPSEDFERYPRDIDRDRRLAREAGVDLLYVPSETAMYPQGPERQDVWIGLGTLGDHLCGASRPGHFRGVATVVAKLLNMAQPDLAYFGQKDAQQAIIISRMARDLAFPVEIRVMPTVREPDGLALSSRNVYLSPAERQQAPVLQRALQAGLATIAQGKRDARAIEAAIREQIAYGAPLGRIDYVTVADLETLQPVEGQIKDPALIALAVFFGKTRLIDNVVVPQAGLVNQELPARATSP